MTAYGVTPAGFVLKPVTQILAEYTGDLLGLIDPTTDVSTDQPLGQALKIGAKKLGEVWQVGQVAYNATNRGDAEADLLDNIGTLSGTLRAGQSHSSVPCALAFSVAGTYAAGALVASPVGSPTSQFQNTYPIVVPTLGDDGIAIGVAHLWTGGAGTTFLFRSLDFGPNNGDALIGANQAALVANGQLSVKVPVAGWISVADAAGVSLGTLEELDPPYRVRQWQDLSAPGNDTLDATRAAILIALQNAPIPVVGASVQMYENTTLTTDPVTGLPGKSYMAVVYDGTAPILAQNNTLIAQAIWNNQSGGGQSVGTVNILTPDSQGTLRPVAFTRATSVAVTMAITVYVSAAMTAPARAALAIAVRVAMTNASQGLPFTLYGNTIAPGVGSQTTLVPGQEVVAEAFRSIAQGQLGVIDAQPTGATLITAPAPEPSGNLPIPIGQYAAPVIAVTVATFAPLA